jgi:hypothetical protein
MDNSGISVVVHVLVFRVKETFRIFRTVVGAMALTFDAESAQAEVATIAFEVNLLSAVPLIVRGRLGRIGGLLGFLRGDVVGC